MGGSLGGQLGQGTYVSCCRMLQEPCMQMTQEAGSKDVNEESWG